MLVNKFMFYFILQRVDDILQFIADFSVNVEGVGHVCRLVYSGSIWFAILEAFIFVDSIVSSYELCFVLKHQRDKFLAISFGSFSTFDFQNHGNSNYGSPYHTPRTQRSSQGKIEKSFLGYEHNTQIVELMRFHVCCI